MKMIILYTVSFLLLYETTVAQPLVIKGRIRCTNQTAKSTKGAENVIVVPTFMPSKSRMTGSEPPGYFEVRTGMTLQQLQDKQVNVHLISKCNDCKESVKRIFVSEDQDRQNRDNKVSYVTVKDWKMAKNCSDVELPGRQADSMLNVVMKQPDLTAKEITNATALVGSPALLNLITTLVTVVVPVPPATGEFKPVSLNEGKVNYGSFLFASAMTHTSNPGFNFSPSRDYSEAVFWNASAISQSRKPSNISLLTNFKNNGKLGGFFRLTDKLSLGLGGIFTMQDEFRSGTFEEISFGLTKFIDSFFLDLKEYAVYLSPSYKINDKLSVGLSAKSIWQDFTIPVQFNIRQFSQDSITNEAIDSTINKQGFDVDFSITYKIGKSFQVGFSAMNLAGTELYADAFIPGDPAPLLQNQRSFGLGLCYKWQRFNFGADMLFTQDDFYDATVGVNYVPFNNALISAGLAIKQLSYSVSFRIKHFRIAYIDDNDFLVNEKRQGKSGILNGKLYGGFSFSF